MDDRARNVVFGFAGGLGAAFVLPFVAPVVGEVVRPLLKVLLKQGLLGLERVRTAAARASESLEDLLAEVRSEVEAELKASEPSVAKEVPRAVIETEIKAVPVRRNPKDVS
jgi:hypothetical protein